VTLAPLTRPTSGEGVGADGHRDGGLVHGDQRQRTRVVRVGQRLADHDVRDAGDGDDVARPGLLGGLALQRLGHQQLGDLHPLDLAVALDPGDLLALADGALVHPAQRDAAEEVRRVQVRHVRLKRGALVVRRRRDGLQDRLEQRLQVRAVRHGAVARPLQRGLSIAGARVDDRELDLLLGRVEIEEELVSLVDDLGDARVGPGRSC